MITFQYLMEAHSGPRERMCYSSRTTWWTHDVAKDSTPSGGLHPIPLDPSGAPLLEVPMREGLGHAEASPEGYGEGGLDLFMFAHHQNCGGRCFKDWDEARIAWKEAGSPKLTEEL